jgi:hypothetical protein
MIDRELVTLIGECVPTGVNYLYGDVNEVIQKLYDMSKTASTSVNKYPVVAMFTDIPDDRGDRPDIQCDVTIPGIIIATETKQSYQAENRLSKIESVLKPIYAELLDNIAKHSAFTDTDATLIIHTKINRLSWGKSAIFSDRNLGIDFIDAIELQNVQLSIKWKIC